MWFADRARSLWTPGLCNWLSDHISKINPIRDRLFPVHRIDRPTSGLVLFARRRNILTQLQQEWDSEHVFKTYLAVVCGFAFQA